MREVTHFLRNRLRFIRFSLKLCADKKNVSVWLNPVGVMAALGFKSGKTLRVDYIVEYNPAQKLAAHGFECTGLRRDKAVSSLKLEINSDYPGARGYLSPVDTVGGVFREQIDYAGVAAFVDGFEQSGRKRIAPIAHRCGGAVHYRRIEVETIWLDDIVGA